MRLSGPRLDSFDSFYSGQYAAASEWRDISAHAKARNIADLWARAGRATPVLRVLDIGCGEGAIAAALAGRDFFTEFVGVDIDPSGVQAAGDRGIAGARFEVFDGSTVPYPDRSFDLAILSHVVEHAEHPRALLNEAGRVATFVFVEVPLELTVRMSRDFEWGPVGHVNFYNPLLIRQLIQSSGLRVLTEKVTCPDLRAFTYHRKGPRMVAAWLLKRGLLAAVPRLATKLLTYHGALLACAPPADGEESSRPDAARRRR